MRPLHYFYIIAGDPGQYAPVLGRTPADDAFTHRKAVSADTVAAPLPAVDLLGPAAAPESRAALPIMRPPRRPLLAAGGGGGPAEAGGTVLDRASGGRARTGPRLWRVPVQTRARLLGTAPPRPGTADPAALSLQGLPPTAPPPTSTDQWRALSVTTSCRAWTKSNGSEARLWGARCGHARRQCCGGQCTRPRASWTRDCCWRPPQHGRRKTRRLQPFITQ